MKIFFYILAAIVAAFVAFRLWTRYQASKLATIYPRADEAAAAAASETQDLASLFNLRTILPPSAMNLRTTIGTIDANPIGGNVGPGFDPASLLSVQRWSPLGGNVSW